MGWKTQLIIFGYECYRFSLKGKAMRTEIFDKKKRHPTWREWTEAERCFSKVASWHPINRSSFISFDLSCLAVPELHPEAYEQKIKNITSSEALVYRNRRNKTNLFCSTEIRGFQLGFRGVFKFVCFVVICWVCF